MASGMTSGAMLGLVLFMRVSAAEPPTAAQRIFRCEVDGHVSFGDRPCRTPVGAKATNTEVVLSPINSYHAEVPHYQAGKSSRSVVARESSDKQSESIAAALERDKQRCQRLADQLRALQEKMRSGYKAKQGEQLRERQRQLEQRRKTERCR